MENNRNVLFVDDDQHLLSSMRRNFSAKFTVHTAQSAGEALDLAAQYEMAVIVTDFRMPNADGIQLLAELQQAAPAAKRIMLTGYPDLQTTIAAVNEGHVAYFLTKPCSTKELGERLEEAVAAYNTERRRNGADTHLDPLTRCLTRPSMEGYLSTLQRQDMACLLIVIDINGLRMVNQLFGYGEGDRLLADLGNHLLGLAERHGDRIGRWGDDLFLLVLPERCEQNVDALIQSIRAFTWKDDAAEEAILSLGYAVFNPPGLVLNAVALAEQRLAQNRLVRGPQSDQAVPELIVRILGEKSAETSGHVRRMKALAQQLAVRLQLPEHLHNRLLLLALLHDVGKVAVAERILEKPQALTETEWVEMKQHSEAGYRIAKAFPDFAEIADEIRYHHERWDGHGYPDGLVGEEIPLLSRIIAVVDAYDVMTHSRPYREPISCSEALAELQRCSGSQFDPDVVKEFVSMQASSDAADAHGEIPSSSH